MKFEVRKESRTFYVYYWSGNLTGEAFAKYIKKLETTAQKLKYTNFLAYRDDSNKLCITVDGLSPLHVDSGRYIVMTIANVMAVGALHLDGMTALSERKDDT